MIDRDRLNLYHANKQRIAQVKQLIEVAGQLANDLTDFSGNSLDHSIYETLNDLDEKLDSVYIDNENIKGE